jgi:hypothetical protein
VESVVDKSLRIVSFWGWKTCTKKKAGIERGTVLFSLVEAVSGPRMGSYVHTIESE